MSASNGNGWIVLRGASGNNLRAIDVAISPDGKTAYTSSMDYTLRAWSLK